ncbi:MAG: hypothetical protein HY292_02460 [Planctomycetes bacterium]|nr:hypothetical protein [Planctomycetota bacterium]
MIPALTLLASLAASSDAPSFEVFANYPATLVHALDAAAGRAHHGSGYRDWLLGPGASDPDWLRVYREKRPTWTSNRDDGDGPYEPYSRVSHDATSVDELVTRPGSVLSADDLVLARNAIVSADKLLAPR